MSNIERGALSRNPSASRAAMLARTRPRTRDQKRYDERREQLGLPVRNSVYIDRMLTPSTWTVYGMLRGGRIVLRAIDSPEETSIRWQTLARYVAQRNDGKRRIAYGKRT